MQKKKVSITDVAHRAGVSITTVSRVINNVPTVSKNNRIKVEEAIAHLNFQPDVIAQRLAAGKQFYWFGNPWLSWHFSFFFYAIEVIRGVGHSCEMLQMDMIFHITNGLKPLNLTQMGGIIFADVIENRKQVEAALANGTPVFVVNHKVDDLNINYIAVDNILGGEIAADYLSGFGHTRIATITGDINTQSGFQRLHGFTRMMKKKQIPLPEEYICKGDYSRRSAREAAEKLLALPQRPTAIFAASDDMALEAIAVLSEKGLKVPEDISVIGFDDNPICLYGSVALTTIRQPLFEMAKDAVRYLYDMMKEKGSDETKRVLLKPELVVRESCAAPKA